MEGLCVLFNAVTIIGVDHINEGVDVLEVVRPQIAKLELAPNVPTIELDLLVLESLNVEANSRNSVDDFVELHLV